MAVHDIIVDPRFAVTPLARLSNQPFTAGQSANINSIRRQEIQQLLQANAGNNPLRSALAQRFAEMEQQNVRTRNIKDIQAAGGAPTALRAAGIPVSGFAEESVATQGFQDRANAQKVASEAANIGRQGGQLPLQSLEDQAITGFNVVNTLPTSVEAANAGGDKGKITVYVNGAKLEMDITDDLIVAGLARARGQPISVAGIQATPQQAKANAFIDKAGRNNPSKVYFTTLREDGVIIINEMDQSTGVVEEVQFFDAQGNQVSG